MIDPSFSYLRNADSQTIATNTPLTVIDQSARLPGTMQPLFNPAISDEYDVLLPDVMDMDSAQAGLPLHDQLLRTNSSTEDIQANSTQTGTPSGTQTGTQMVAHQP